MTNFLRLKFISVILVCSRCFAFWRHFASDGTRDSGKSRANGRRIHCLWRVFLQKYEIYFVYLILNKPILAGEDDCAVAAASYDCGKEKFPDVTKQMYDAGAGDYTVV